MPWVDKPLVQWLSLSQGSVRAGVACAGLAVAALAAAPAESATREEVQARAKMIFGVLPEAALNPANPLTPEKIDLGRQLYFEKRFSLGQEISCNTCHDLATFGVDNEPTSAGHKGQRGARNSPTVYNAAFHIAQFWDGRAKDVEEQAKGPVLNPVEMAMPSAGYVVRVMKSIPGYAPLFAAAFPGEADPVNFDNFALAIAAFERELVTPSRFDDFLGGQTDALSDAEVAGLEKFMEVGCPTCHQGAPVGGLMFQKLGLVHPFETKDLGRFDATQQESDKLFFKVPSLRNVAETHPYFHDGSVATLDEAIRLMAWHQLDKRLGDEEVQSIATFLKSLTGKIDPAYIAAPEPLPAGPDTPTPDAPDAS